MSERRLVAVVVLGLAMTWAWGLAEAQPVPLVPPRVDLSRVGGTNVTLGAKAAAASIPVVLPTGTSVVVTGPDGGTLAVNSTIQNAQLAVVGGDGGTVAVNVTGTPTIQGRDGGYPVEVSGTTFSYAEPPDLTINRRGVFNGTNSPAWTYHIMGRRDQGWSSTSVLNDVAQYLDTSQCCVNAVVGGNLYTIRSSSANDTNGGTGANTVRVVYLDSNGLLQTQTATLAGTTHVSLGTNVYYVEWMEVASVGSNNLSVGNITISTGAAGVAAPTVAQTVEWINAGANRSLSGRFKVPSDASAYLASWDAQNIGNATQDIRVRYTAFMDDRSLSTVFHFLDTAYLSSAGSALNGSDTMYQKVPANAEIKVSTLSGNTASSNRLDVSMQLVVIKN